jgi:hypothetical protein
MRSFKLRTHERITHFSEVFVHAPEHGREDNGCAIDLSQSGCKFSTDMPLSVGDEVELTWAERVPMVTLGGRVVNVTPHDEGLFAGVKFHQPLSLQVFRELQQHRPASMIFRGAQAM